MGRLIRDGAWVAAGQIIGAIGTLVGLRLLTEVAPPEVYGPFVLIVAATLLVQSLLFVPPSQALLRHFADSNSAPLTLHLRQAYIYGMGRLVLFVGLVIVGVFAAGDVLFDWPTLLGVSIAGMIAVEGVRLVAVNLASAMRHQRAYGLMIALDGWLRPLGAIAAASVYPGSALALFFGQVISVSLVAAACMLLQKPYWIDAVVRGSARQNLEEVSRKMKSFGNPLIPSVLVTWLSGLSDRYVIAILLTISDAGTYAAAYGLVSRPFLVASTIVEATLRQPLYEAIATRNSNLEANLIRAWHLAVLGVGFVGCALVFLLKDHIVWIFLAKEYASSSNLLPWIAVGYAIVGVSQLYERICLAYQETHLVLIIQTVGAITAVACSIGGVLFLGLQGAAIAVPIAFGLQTLFAYRIARSVADRKTVTLASATHRTTSNR